MFDYEHDIKFSVCYLCGAHATFRCDYIDNGTCEHEMCDQHAVLEFGGGDPVPVRRFNPYTLCLFHKEAVKPPNDNWKHNVRENT